MTTPPAKPTGLLLAGGQSRRMRDAFAEGQNDKALLDIGGKPMLAHVIDRLAPQVGDLLINANGDPSRFAAFGLPVIADTIAGFAGPLAGLLTGMRWSRQHAPQATHVLSVSTDAPFLPADLAAKLQSAVRDKKHAVAIASSGGKQHPVIGLWPTGLADELEAALLAGTRKVSSWTQGIDTVTVDFPPVRLQGHEVDPFFNANTPEDLATVRDLLAQRGSQAAQQP
jgi:molybdopterin-guanine dinucleotide biosynthesis protein A